MYGHVLQANLNDLVPSSTINRFPHTGQNKYISFHVETTTPKNCIIIMQCKLVFQINIVKNILW